MTKRDKYISKIQESILSEYIDPLLERLNSLGCDNDLAYFEYNYSFGNFLVEYFEERDTEDGETEVFDNYRMDIVIHVSPVEMGQIGYFTRHSGVYDFNINLSVEFGLSQDFIRYDEEMGSDFVFLFSDPLSAEVIQIDIEGEDLGVKDVLACGMICYLAKLLSFTSGIFDSER